MRSFSLISVLVGSLIVSSQGAPTTIYSTQVPVTTAAVVFTSAQSQAATQYPVTSSLHATTTVLVVCPTKTSSPAHTSPTSVGSAFTTTYRVWNATSTVAATTALPKAFDVIISIFTTVSRAESTSAPALVAVATPASTNIQAITNVLSTTRAQQTIVPASTNFPATTVYATAVPASTNAPVTTVYATTSYICDPFTSRIPVVYTTSVVPTVPQGMVYTTSVVPTVIQTSARAFTTTIQI